VQDHVPVLSLENISIVDTHRATSMAPSGKLGRNIRPARRQESEDEPEDFADEIESAGSDARSASESDAEDDGW
jgi:hypothetical protein